MKRLTMDEAVTLLRSGEIVALPTETVYGLAGRADSEESVRKIFEAKGRPAENPLICHIGSLEMLERYAVVAEDDRALLSLWPGPFTILLPKRDVPDIVTAGSHLCAFRMPAHALFLDAIQKTGVPLAAPSANRSGETSPVTAEMVETSLEGRIPGVVDGGPCSVGIESTVVLREGDRIVRILRPGAITEAQFEALGYTVARNGAPEIDGRGLLSPGRLPVHYAPSVPLILVDRRYTPELLDRLHRYLNGESGLFRIAEQRIDIGRIDRSHPAVLRSDADSGEDRAQHPDQERGQTTERSSYQFQKEDLAAFAARLYRTLDEMSRTASVILTFSVADEGIGRAINDRLRRAASLRLIPSDTGSAP